jgi:chromosome segregation ATPase
MTNQKITSKYEEERVRAAEQSQIVYLQGQIDELRRTIKDQTNKYNWAMEQVRRVEGSIAQFEAAQDRLRQEITTALEGYRRDITTLRKDIANVLVKAEESVKPIREIQAQIHQLGETRKQDRDYVASWLLRIEELEQSTRGWYSQLKESDERHRAIVGRFDALYAADDAARVEIRKVAEELQVEKQSLRRQAVEAQQLVGDLRSILDEQHSRIARLDDIRHQIDVFAEKLPGEVAALDVRISELVGEIKRVDRQASEQFLVTQERIEDVRHQQEEKVTAIQEADEHHVRQLTSWIERVDNLVRELDQRLIRVNSRFEGIQREHASHLGILEQRDVQIVENLLIAVRDQFERIKTDQIERGISSEGQR